MADIDLGRVIAHTHPAFDYTAVTDRDILQWSVIAGLPPRILTGIVQGRIKITDLVLSRLLRVFPTEVTDKLVNDYDPLRGLEFEEKKPDRRYKITTYYPATLLSNRDMILCDDGRWLVLSSTDRKGASIQLYSHGIPVSRISDNDEVTAAVFNKDIQDDKQRDIHDVIAQNKHSQEFFKGAGLSPEREEMSSYVMGKLLEKRYGK